MSQPWLSCLSRNRALSAVSVASRGWSTSCPGAARSSAATDTMCLEQHRWQSAAEARWLWGHELAAYSGPGKQCLDVSLQGVRGQEAHPF